jgi:hypothetical protein
MIKGYILFLYSDMECYIKKAIAIRIKKVYKKCIKRIKYIRIIICIYFMNKYKSVDMVSIITI